MEIIKIVKKKKKNHGKVVENSIVKSHRKVMKINTIIKSHKKCMEIIKVLKSYRKVKIIDKILKLLQSYEK